MSTQYSIHEDANFEVEINESSAQYDLDVYIKSKSGDSIRLPGPEYMTAQQAVDMGYGILYSVWCMYPDLVQIPNICELRDASYKRLEAYKKREASNG